MRVILTSNAPWTQTGYGVQCKHILRTIRDLGYPVACVAFWGCEGGKTVWENVPIYGRMLDGYGNDAIPHAIKDFKADVVFTLIDLWVMDVNTGRHGAMFCPLFPVDHDPVPEVVAARFPHADRLITYARYGERKAKEYQNGRYAHKVIYIPHMVDCKAYYPATIEEKMRFRKRLYPDWPEDAFICLMVAANKGFPCRKSFPEALEAFAMFARDCPEARLYLHSYPNTEFSGPNLMEMAIHFGINDKVHVLNPTMMLAGDYDDELMRQIYTSCDVLLSPSQGEGFGVPLIESQSCGIPVIVQDFSAMSELVGAGWRVPPLRLTTTLLWAKQAEADVQGIYHALKEARWHLPNVHMSAMAREFALRYDVPTVTETYWKPFLASLDAGRMDMTRELRETRLT